MKANLCEHDNLKEHGCHCETCASCGKTVYPCSRHRKNSDLEEVERSEGVISKRLKAWLEFNNGKVDENTQMFIDDVQDLEQKLTTANKRIDQLEAELEQKDKLIAELLDDNVKADDTIEIYYNKSKALEFEVEKKDKIISELKNCLEFYAELKNYTELHDYKGLHNFEIIGSNSLQDRGDKARETIKRVEGMENG